MTLATVIARSRRDLESWRYTNIEKLLAADISATRGRDLPIPSPGTAGPPEIVFVDGVLAPERSQFGDLPPDIITGDAQKGYCLTLAGQTCLATQPTTLRFITSSTPPAEVTTKLHIVLGASGRLSLLERHEGTAFPFIIETRIDLAKQAKLVHGKFITGDGRRHGAQSEPVSAGAYMGFTNVTIAEGGFYDNFNLIKGGRLTRNEIEARLEGPLAQCALNGLMLLSGDDHADTALRVIHAAVHGTSRQFYKTIAGGKAHGIFQGRIVVEKGADKADGRQLSRALLLSQQAEVDAKPELEINADDVKCSHGCAIGNIDTEALFYLRSRGLGEGAARALLIRAFAAETLAEIPVPEWRDRFEAELEGWCDEQN